MILYLTKVILCSAAFWAFYRWGLQREQMFGFNRIYLLLTPILAVFIPFYQIEVLLPAMTDAPMMMLPDIDESVTMESIESSWTIWNYASALYLLVATMLLIRLLINLVRIMHSTRQAKTYQWREKTIVTLPKNVVPYSFLDYIFISENATDQETLLQHEYAHARQWHSADILVIEVLQIIFWCNPVLHLYRRSMRLNHEFLADAATINYTSIKDYQRLLLQVATAHDKHYLASGFNYFFIKNRLEMMTKTTSTVRRRVLQSLAALLLVVMTFFAAERVYAQSIDGATKKELAEFKKLYDSTLGEDGVRYYGEPTTSKMMVILNKMSEAQLEEYGYMLPPPPPPPPAPPSVTPPPPPPSPTSIGSGIEDLLNTLDQYKEIRLDFKTISAAEAREAIKSGKVLNYRLMHSVTSPKLHLFTKTKLNEGIAPPPPPPPPAPPSPEMLMKIQQDGRAFVDGEKVTDAEFEDILKNKKYNLRVSKENGKEILHISNVRIKDLQGDWKKWLKMETHSHQKGDKYFLNGVKKSLEDLFKIDMSQYRHWYASSTLDTVNKVKMTNINVIKK